MPVGLRRSASVSAPARKPSEDKGGAPAAGSQPKAAQPRRPLAFYEIPNKAKQLLAVLVPGGKRLPAQLEQPAKPDAGIPIYDQLMKQPDGQLNSLMSGFIHPYLGTPQQSAEQLHRIEGIPAEDQTQQCRVGQLRGFARTTDIKVSKMPPGVQLMLGPMDGARSQCVGPGDVMYSPAVYLGRSDEGHILVRSAFDRQAIQSDFSKLLSSDAGIPVETRPAQDGWGYLLTIPIDPHSEDSTVGIDFLVKNDAASIALSNEQMLRLPLATRLLIQIPFTGKGKDEGAKTTSAQPAIFLGAKMAGNGRVVLKVRAPWAPAHVNQDGIVAYKHTKLMQNHVGKTAMLLRTSGTVPQPASYQIGPGPLVASQKQSGGWFEWEAPLHARTVVRVDPYFGPMPELEPAPPALQYGALPQAMSSASNSSSSMGSTQSGELGLDSEPGVQDTKGPGGSAAALGGLSHVQCINLQQDTPVRVTRGDGETVDAEFAGDADSADAPNAIWVVAPRDALSGALSGALQHVAVPGDPGSFSYLVSLSTHRVELAQA